VNSLLELDEVDVRYGETSALSRVSLAVGEGEVFGLVGESGCGKTTLALATMGLLPDTATVTGTMRFAGRDLLTLSPDERRSMRGDRVSMIFQDPATALDPAFSIGEQVAETIRAHRPVGRRESKLRALHLLREVGIPDPERRYGDPPHRFSGGMQQRVVIAIAIANDPALLIADEPTTALDVTIQAQILALLLDLRRRHGTTIVLIAHDLGVVAQLCDRAGVLYAGQLVEVATAEQLFTAAGHPYTEALLAAQPDVTRLRGTLAGVRGAPPDPSALPPGCRYAPRCPLRLEACERTPVLEQSAPDHLLACWARRPNPTGSLDSVEAGVR
jgi:oligopeptide/dipeptide ABC transporter ATP-binding protein